jgi:hypothetical protein
MYTNNISLLNVIYINAVAIMTITITEAINEILLSNAIPAIYENT